MSHVEINIVCPDCKGKILLGGNVEIKSITMAPATIAKTKVQKIKAPPKKAVSKKKKITKKKVPKKGKYDKDLEKLFKLKSGGPAEDLELALEEKVDSKEVMKKISDAAKKTKKELRKTSSVENKIESFLSGDTNPFNEG